MMPFLWMISLALVGFYGHAQGVPFLLVLWGILGLLGVRLLRSLREAQRVDEPRWEN